MKNSKITILALTICCVIVCLCVFGGCEKGNSAFAKNTLSITDKLSYDPMSIAKNFEIEKEVCLAKDGMTSYVIVIPEKSSVELIEETKIFTGYLNKIVGNDIFKIITDAMFHKGLAISFSIKGNGAIIDDGYSISTTNENIKIVALTELGLVNAMYGFLEDYLECMFVRDDFDYIPNLKTIYLDSIETVSNPSFALRYFSSVFAKNSRLSKLKLNGSTFVKSNISSNLDAILQETDSFAFVDPKVYFKNHSEYFAYFNGKRCAEWKGKETQLCLTNPDIYEIVKEGLQKNIEQDPNKMYLSFSINDNSCFCECDECNKINMKGGSKLTTAIVFLNKLSLDFSDKIISTTIYNHNEKIPNGIALKPNINIVLSLEDCTQKYSYALENNKNALSVNEALIGWGSISQNITIFDYVVNTENLLLPFPSLSVQAENLKFYKANNVIGVFHNGGLDEDAELGSLRSYIMSKQLWNLDADIEKIIAKYLAVTYEDAKFEVAKYIELQNNLNITNKSDLKSGDKVKNYKSSYLSSKAIKQYLKIIDAAMLVGKNDIINNRLEEIKIGVLYAKMNGSSYDFKGKKQAADEFLLLTTKHNITTVSAYNDLTAPQYVDKVFSKQMSLKKFELSVIVIVPILTSVLILFFLLKVKKSKNHK